MYTYRITKYISAYRDRFDSYGREEWTGRRNIGKTVGGHTLTEDEYLEIENKYLSAFQAFAHEAGVQVLTLKDLFLGPGAPERLHGLREGAQVTIDEAVDLVRTMLREEPLRVLLDDGDRFYAHVGDNMYMWLGSEIDCVNAIADTQWIGLYVDRDITSPLWDDGERFWWLKEGAPVRHVLFGFQRDTDEPGGTWVIPDDQVDAVRALVQVRDDDPTFYDTYDIDDVDIPALEAILGVTLDPGPVYYRVTTRSVED